MDKTIMDKTIIINKLVESAGKLERQLDLYQCNKDRCNNYDKIVYYAQYFKGICDLAIALGFAPEDIDIITHKAWHYVNKEL